MGEELVKNMLDKWAKSIKKDPKKFLDNFNYYYIKTKDEYDFHFYGESDYKVRIKYYDDHEAIKIEDLKDNVLFNYLGRYKNKKIIEEVSSGIYEYLLPLYKKKQEEDKKAEENKRLEKLKELTSKLEY